MILLYDSMSVAKGIVYIIYKMM